MSQPDGRFDPLKRREKLACAVAAGTCSLSLAVGMLTLFDRAAPGSWLLPTDPVLQAKARCDALPERAAQLDCNRQLVASRLADDQSRRLASR